MARITDAWLWLTNQIAEIHLHHQSSSMIGKSVKTKIVVFFHVDKCPNNTAKNMTWFSPYTMSSGQIESLCSELPSSSSFDLITTTSYQERQIYCNLLRLSRVASSAQTNVFVMYSVHALVGNSPQHTLLQCCDNVEFRPEFVHFSVRYYFQIYVFHSCRAFECRKWVFDAVG